MDIYDKQGVGEFEDPYRYRDSLILAKEELKPKPKDEFTDRVSLPWRLLELKESQLALANERIFFLVGELAAANRKLGITDYKTVPAYHL
jgi:hypothetical protein